MVSRFAVPALNDVDPLRTNLRAVPGAIVTFPDVPDFPDCRLALNCPVPERPVYLRLLPREAIPDEKSFTRFNTLSRPAPTEATPLRPTGLMVTGASEASKDVTVLPQSSSALRVFVPVNATLLVCGETMVNANLPTESAETVTESRSIPRALIEPSVTEIVALSALYNLIEPLLPPLVVATPLTKVIDVPVPKFTARPELLVTVGAVTGSLEEFAPENVSVFAPK
jgi:hypothetical protein